MSTSPTVFIIDDDPELCDALKIAIESSGLQTRSFPSAEQFLAELPLQIAGPVCAPADIRLPGLSGLGLLTRLKQRGVRLPIIVISGHADIPLAVSAMKAGAVDFLQKPVHRQLLMQQVQNALDQHAQEQQTAHDESDIAGRVATVSGRERDVMTRLADGLALKEIAAELEVSHQTVAKHRASLFDKLGIDSLAQLVRIQIQVEQSSHRPVERSA